MLCPNCHLPINLGALLGRSKSPAKTAAARRNARKGGWPKGKPRKPVTETTK